MNVLERINELRNKRGWSVNELAKKSGLNQSTLSSLYQKNNNPSITTLESLCKAFGMTMSQFFAGESDCIDLTDQQRQLLDRWNTLTEEQKDTLLHFLNNI